MLNGSDFVWPDIDPISPESIKRKQIDDLCDSKWSRLGQNRWLDLTQNCKSDSPWIGFDKQVTLIYLFQENVNQSFH